MSEHSPTLTKWQARRRKGADGQRRLMSTLFLTLAIAMLVYFIAITRIIAPVFPPKP